MTTAFTLFLRLAAVVGTVLFVLSIVVMLLTFRKAKQIAPAPLLITIILSLLTLWIYSIFLGVHFTGAIKFWSLFCGILAGIGWALTTPVRARKGIVEREGNAWYLAVWAIIFAVNQFAIAITGRPPRIAMVLLLLGTGIVLGNSGTFIARYYQVKGENG